MIGKAVGVVLDMFAEDEAPQANVTAFNWGSYAAESIAKAASDSATPALGPLASFARDLIAYAAENPADIVANRYAKVAVDRGSEALTDFAATQPELASKILDVRAKRTQAVQTAGESNIAADLWPGVTEYLSQISTKANLLEQLKTSEALVVSLMELCMEIAMDNQWTIEPNKMAQEVDAARATRTFGRYAADTRA